MMIFEFCCFVREMQELQAQQHFILFYKITV